MFVPEKQPDSKEPTDNKQSIYHKRAKLTLEIRKQTIKKSQLKRMAAFIDKFKQNVNNLSIIDPLKHFSSLTSQEAHQSIKNLFRQSSNREFNQRLEEIQFEKTLFEILKTTDSLYYKGSIIEALSNLSYFCESATNRLYEMNITVFLIEELLNIQPDFDDVSYITDIVSLVKNLTRNVCKDKQMIRYFIDQGYFKLVVHKVFSLDKDISEISEDVTEILGCLCSTMTNFLQSREIDDQFIKECLNFIIDDQEGKMVFIKPQEICNLYSAIFANGSEQILMNYPNFYVIFFGIAKFIEECEDDELAIEILKTLYVAAIELPLQIGQINSISSDFLIKCFKSENFDVRSEAVGVLSLLFQQFQSTVPFEYDLFQLIAKTVLNNLTVENKYLVQYVQLLQALCHQVEWKESPQILMQLNVLGRMKVLMADHSKVSGYAIISLLQTLKALLSFGQQLGHNKVKAVMQSQKMHHLMFSIQESPNVKVSELASEVLDMFDHCKK